MDAWLALGSRPRGVRLERIRKSPQHDGTTFVNALPTRNDTWAAMRKWLRGVDNVTPTTPVPLLRRRADDFAAPPPDELRVTWLGHSTMLIELEGLRFLTDPVWSRRISPSPAFGPERFFEPPLPLDELPPLDAVLLSHDHFDHLDMPTIRALARRSARFIAPLGVGAHLLAWGVAEEFITELDWWESLPIGHVELVCTPARHFSGRAPGGRDATLWGGFALLGRRRRAFFSGDSAMFPGFAEIGQRCGPFDLTLLEAGAYDAAWADVHMGPEQAVEAHRALRGRLLMPVHWGTFNLALHGWTEPAERVLIAASARNVSLAIPRPGESVVPDRPLASRWWPELPWQSAEQAPVVSSGLDAAVLAPT